MEVKINKEIRNYTEAIFFGLSFRQLIFSVCACIVAVIIYFLLKPYFAIDELSWMCILGAFPFAILGFVTYNGMTAEEFIIAWIKSEILMPKVLMFKPVNYYYEIYNTIYEDMKKKRWKEDEISRKQNKKRKGQYESSK